MGDEAFRELSKVDPEGNKLLDDVSLISKFLSPLAEGDNVYGDGPVLTLRTLSFCCWGDLSQRLVSTS